MRKTSLFWTLFFICLLFNVTAQENGEKKSKLWFADKVIHSFGLQYNNTFHAKGKFEYRGTPNYYLGGHPCISYGREYIVKYNLTYPSGWGITAEFVAGNRDFMTWRRYRETDKKIYLHSLWRHSLQPFIDYTYFGGQIKVSYRYRLHEQITMQPEMGIKLLKYRQQFYGSLHQTIIPDEFGNPVITESWQWRELHNDSLYKRFMPELTIGVNFLFHSRKDPRHNFILGVNATLGFIDRYEGWQRFTETDQIDVRMRYGSSFFALNMGYEFTGFKKPEHKTKKYRKEIQQFETFDFSKPVHSVGVYFTSGFYLNTRIKDAQGEYRPEPKSSFLPELNFRYSLSVKNGFGFAVEIPIGLFLRKIDLSLRMHHIPIDSVWADGKATGPGYPNRLIMRVPYAGLSLKFSYLARIHRNMFIQPEAGIKFMPFMFPAESFEQDSPLAENVYYTDMEGKKTDIVWLHNNPAVLQENYAIPDITLAVNFMVHGKKPHHNFIFGVNANIGLVDRVSWEYHTTEVIPSHLQSSGKYGWKSSYIGFHVGYQFMTANKEKK
jgi:hypothetical protein